MTTTTVKKTKPVKNTAPIKKTSVKAGSKNRAKAFLNWSVPMADGREFRSGKGFPIFQNPAYPNAQEDKLIELARKHGGSVELTMKVKIVVNESSQEEVSLDDFIVG